MFRLKALPSAVLLAALMSSGVASGQQGLIASPLVVFATGQSNAVLQPAFSWSPNRRAKIWNFNGDDGNIGTAFIPINPRAISVTWKFASEIARASPGRDVCLITIAFPAKSITHWLSGYSRNPAVSPDIYANIQNNIGPALAACGATSIDYLLWWQGETDAGDVNYPSRFETVMGRFRSNPWFAPSTSIVIFGVGVAGFTDQLARAMPAMNVILQSLVATDPANRIFVPSVSLPASPYWDLSSPGHMTASGYDALGSLAASMANKLAKAR